MTSGKQTRVVSPGPARWQVDTIVAHATHPVRASLMVSTGDAAGVVFPLTDASVLIGRSRDAQVCIDEHAISNEHARLQSTGAAFTLRDLGSTNGTWVNGQRIVGDVVLSGGDSIRMGSTTFTLVMNDAIEKRGTRVLHGASGDLPLAPHQPRAPELPHSVAKFQARGRASPSEADEAEASMSLADMVHLARTYWVYLERYGLLIASCICLGGIAGVVRAWLHPPPASAWFEMSLTQNAHGTSDEAPESFAAAEVTFRSLPLIEKTLSELGSLDVHDPSATHRLASDVQSALSFERVGPSSAQVYRGDYEDATAERAMAFLDKHLHVYIDSEVDKVLNALRADAAFDLQQEQQAEQRAANARNRLIDYSDEHPDVVPRDTRLIERPSARLAPGTSPERIRQRIASTERALGAEYEKIQSQKARPYLAQVAAAESKIAEARARGLRDQHPEIRGLSNLQTTMRRKANSLLAAEPSPNEKSLHPLVVTLEEELSELRARLAQTPASSLVSENDPAHTAAAALGARSLNADAPRAAGAASRLQPALPSQASTVSLSELEFQYAELSREYERSNTEHEVLLKKREATQRLLERERTNAEARYAVITPPTALKRSSFSATVRRGGVGAGIGLLLALVAAAALELRRLLLEKGHL